MEDERTYLRHRKDQCWHQTCPIKPMDLCPLANSSHWRNDTGNRLFFFSRAEAFLQTGLK